MKNWGSNNVCFSWNADRDIQRIILYTVRKWSRYQADKYVKMLYSTCDRIATAPTMYGKDYKELGGGIRGYIVGKHIIFYRVVADGIEVIRIMHQSSNWQTIRL